MMNTLKKFDTRYLLTDSDADGVGCSVVFNAFADHLPDKYSPELSLVKFSYPGKTIDADLAEWFNERKLNPQISWCLYITDLCPSVEALKPVVEYANETGNCVVVYDHHVTALPVMEAFPENVLVECRKDQSAAKLFWRETIASNLALVCYDTKGHKILKYFKVLKRFVDLVSDYDTWEWKNNPNPELNGEENYVDMLLRFYGDRDYVRKKFYINIFYEKKVFTVDDRNIIDLRLKHIKDVVERTPITITSNEFPFTCGIIMANDCLAASLEKIYKNYDVDYAISLVPEKRLISVRTGKEDHSCLDAINYFCDPGMGGGHEKAAGGTVSVPMMLKLMAAYYNGKVVK